MLVGAVLEDAAREAYWGQVRGSAVQFNSAAKLECTVPGADTTGDALPGGGGEGGLQGHLRGGEGARRGGSTVQYSAVQCSARFRKRWRTCWRA